MDIGYGQDIGIWVAQIKSIMHIAERRLDLSFSNPENLKWISTAQIKFRDQGDNYG